MNDTTKLCKLLLRILHVLTTEPYGSRTERLTEAGYLLRDLEWPSIVDDLNNNKYEWNERLDLRGFDK